MRAHLYAVAAEIFRRLRAFSPTRSHRPAHDRARNHSIASSDPAVATRPESATIERGGVLPLVDDPFTEFRFGSIDVRAIPLGVDERVDRVLRGGACGEIAVPAHSLAWELTQMSARSSAARIPPIATRLHALTRSLSLTGNDHDVQPRVWPPVTCA